MDSVIRGVAVYLVLLVIMRFAGRRTLSELTPFDFVLLLIIAETTQQALLGDDFSIVNSVVLIVTRSSFTAGTSRISNRIPTSLPIRARWTSRRCWCWQASARRSVR